MPKGAERSETTQNSPTLVFSAMLANIAVEARTGKVRLGSGLQSAYMPKDATGTVVLSRQRGSQIFNWNWFLDTFPLPKPYKLLGFENALGPDGMRVAFSDLSLSEPGAYVFDFYLDGKRFQTFPFTLRILDSEDKFGEDKLYLADGAWNDWGYLYYLRANPENALLWKIFMRSEAGRVSSHSIDVRIVSEGTGDVICSSPPEKSYRLSNDWVRQDIVLFGPGADTSGRNYFRAKNLLRKAGNYTLEMRVDGDIYGKWRFSIEAGQLVRKGRASRDTADAVEFIEGGSDAFWYRKE